MAGCPRPNTKAMKIAYKILNVPKEKQQNKRLKPTEKRLREWFVDSLASQ